MKHRALIIGVVALALAIVLPFLLPLSLQQVLLLSGEFALLALGLNVVVGFAGLLDLGYVAFWAIGAYTAAIFLGAAPTHPVPWVLPVWAVFPISMVVCMLAGFVLGAPVLRLRGDYLAIVTLGFGEIVRLLSENLVGITRGTGGIHNIPGPTIPLPGKNYDFGVDIKPFYFLVMAIILVAMFVLSRLDHSRIGRAWVAIREDEFAAEAMGVNTLQMKLLAFAIGAGVASFAGVIQATNLGALTPSSYTVFISISILAMVVLGGMGNMFGAIVGALVITAVPEILRDSSIVRSDRIAGYVENYRFLVFGALLVIMMIFRPQGIVPSKRRALEMTHAASADRGTNIPSDGAEGTF